MTLSCVVSEKFNVEKFRDLEIPVKSQSKSLKVVPFDRMGIVFCLYSIVTLSLRQLLTFWLAFEIFDFKNAGTSKTGLGVRQGRW